MRTPVIAVFTAVAISPSLVGAMPAQYAGTLSPRAHQHTDVLIPRDVAGLGFMGEVFGRAEADGQEGDLPRRFLKHSPRQLMKTIQGLTNSKGIDSAGHVPGSLSPTPGLPPTSHSKRVTDDQTMGGNAHSGKAGDANGGVVENPTDNAGMPTVLNMDSNNAGQGGHTTSGCASAGKGSGSVPAGPGGGGNASSGDSGDAKGGSVSGSGGMMNIDSNNAGDAGATTSGCATGGNS